jgi:hypothetical protein
VVTELGVRFLVVFAFLQTMHYFVWVAFLPRYAPGAARAFEDRAPWLAGRRAWALGAGLGGVLAVLFAIDYASGKALYAAFASYHAYLEFPVLLAVLFSLRGSPVSQLISPETPTSVRLGTHVEHGIPWAPIDAGYPDVDVQVDDAPTSPSHGSGFQGFWRPTA